MALSPAWAFSISGRPSENIPLLEMEICSRVLTQRSTCCHICRANTLPCDLQVCIIIVVLTIEWFSTVARYDNLLGGSAAVK